jgi:hypothetical protein
MNPPIPKRLILIIPPSRSGSQEIAYVHSTIGQKKNHILRMIRKETITMIIGLFASLLNLIFIIIQK